MLASASRWIHGVQYSPSVWWYGRLQSVWAAVTQGKYSVRCAQGAGSERMLLRLSSNQVKRTGKTERSLFGTLAEGDESPS